MADTPVRRVGRYELLAEVGRGAMGVVYQARDPQLDRLVAIKTLRQDLGLPPEVYQDLRRRFFQEAMAAGRLNHPRIVGIYDVLEQDGLPYIVMEYLEGRTLAEIITAEGRLPPVEAARLIREVAEALDYAHARDVIHRDVKPANIVVTRDGAAKVTDFGIARVAGSDLTRTGVMLGTPSYLSPEQVRGQAVGRGSDLFALTVVLYETLTGVNPFRHDDVATVLYLIAHQDPAPVRQRNPEVPAALEAITTRGLAKDPSQRYPTAHAFAEALGDALRERAAPGQGRRAIHVAASRHWPRRTLASLGSAGVLLVSVGGWMLWGRLGSEPGAMAAPLGRATIPATTPVGASPIRADPEAQPRPRLTRRAPEQQEAAEAARGAQRAPEARSRQAEETVREVQQKLEETAREFQEKAKEGSREVLDKLRSAIGRLGDTQHARPAPKLSTEPETSRR